LNKGILYAGGAYLLWGFFPIFWKQLSGIPAQEILGHRIFWSFFFLLIILTFKKRWDWFPKALIDRTVLLTFLGTATLLAVNWITYIWGVNSGFIIETSLGYFINPLVNVLLGVLFLKEGMRPWQWAAIGVAAAGVGWLTIRYGSLPWIALTLALTFGFYGLLRKTASVEALEGLSLEIFILFIPALGYLMFLNASGLSSFGHVKTITSVLLAISGLVTAVPLLLFSAGARRIKLVTLGVLQYMAPSIQLLIGVFMYGEPFPVERMVGFGLIWLALLIYSIEGVVSARKKVTLGLANPIS